MKHPLPLLTVLLLAPLAASLIQMAISRAREFEADRGGAEISGDPRSLASALQKIIVLLRARTGADFSGYKPATIYRRA